MDYAQHLSWQLSGGYEPVGPILSWPEAPPLSCLRLGTVGERSQLARDRLLIALYSYCVSFTMLSVDRSRDTSAIRRTEAKACTYARRPKKRGYFGTPNCLARLVQDRSVSVRLRLLIDPSRPCAPWRIRVE